MSIHLGMQQMKRIAYKAHRKEKPSENAIEKFKNRMNEKFSATL